MKLLIVCQALDLRYGLGTTPSWWQLLKALHYLGTETIVIPYLGEPVETPWWRTYPNPCARESKLYNLLFEKRFVRTTGGHGPTSRISRALVNQYVNPKWKKHIFNVLEKEPDIAATLLLSVPINHLTGIPSLIKTQSKMPIVYYDGDMPTILPGNAEERGFRFSYYSGADLSEYDAFLTNSKGVTHTLKQMGARNVGTMYYGIDPDLYSPLDNTKQDIDIFYYGHGSRTRESRLGFMIAKPSRELPDVRFVVAGRSFDVDLGLATEWGNLSLPAWRAYCCRSKINLNITRDIHASIYASSTARIFELASLGCCIVSDPYAGLEEWFEIGQEVLVVHDEKEAVEAYKHLLAHPEIRSRMGRQARERVLREHTYVHRARQLVALIGELVAERQ